MDLKLESASEPFGTLVKSFLGYTSIISDLPGPGWSQRICILNKHPVDAGVFDPGNTL